MANWRTHVSSKRAEEFYNKITDEQSFIDLAVEYASEEDTEELDEYYLEGDIAIDPEYLDEE